MIFHEQKNDKKSLLSKMLGHIFLGRPMAKREMSSLSTHMETDAMYHSVPNRGMCPKAKAAPKVSMISNLSFGNVWQLSHISVTLKQNQWFQLFCGSYSMVPASFEAAETRIAHGPASWLTHEGALMCGHAGLGSSDGLLL